MLHLLHSVLLASSDEVSRWGYFLIFLGSIFEAIPLVGIFIPGATIVSIGGFFGKIGALNIGLVFVIGVAGAVVGDLIGYFLGVKYGNLLLLRYGKYFLFKPEYFEKTKKFVDRHAGKSLIIGRFHGLTRCFAPFLAGSSGVGFRRFMYFNIVGGFFWSLTYTLLGYIFGRSYERVSNYLGFVFLGALIFSFSIIYIYRFLEARRHMFNNHYFYALVTAVISLYAFAKVLESSLWGTVVPRWNRAVYLAIQYMHSPVMIKIMSLYTSLFDTAVLSIAGVLLVGYLVYRRHRLSALFVTFSMFATLASGYFLKTATHVLRPPHPLVSASGGAFPSGHTMMATVFILCLIYIFKNDIQSKIRRRFFITFGFCLILLTAFSRLYLNVHWLSDVFGGMLLGIFWFSLSLLIFRAIDHIRNPRPLFSSKKDEVGDFLTD